VSEVPIDVSRVRFEVRTTAAKQESLIEITDELEDRGFPCVRRGRRLSVGVAHERDAAIVSDVIRTRSPVPLPVEVRPFTRLRRWHFQLLASGGYWRLLDSLP
jgi:hypothetical protein